MRPRDLALTLLAASLLLGGLAQAAAWKSGDLALFGTRSEYDTYPWGQVITQSTGSREVQESHTWYGDDLWLNVDPGEEPAPGTLLLLRSIVPLEIAAGLALVGAAGAWLKGGRARSAALLAGLGALLLALAMVCFYLGTTDLHAVELPEARPVTSAWILLPILSALCATAAAGVALLTAPSPRASAA